MAVSVAVVAVVVRCPGALVMTPSLLARRPLSRWWECKASSLPARPPFAMSPARMDHPSRRG